MFHSLLDWMCSYPKDLEKQLDDEVCAHYGCCGFKRVVIKRSRPRNKEGKFIATREIPHHLRDLTAFEFWAYETYKIKFKTRQALINAFNTERGL
jgi:hypothetical protein